MATATFNGTVIARSDAVKVVEGNVYFPIDSVDQSYLRTSKARSLCFWKGIARYYTVEVDGMRNENAAWYYPRPSPLARRIKGHVAFWRGVIVDAG